MNKMKVVIAIDSLKGSLTSLEAGNAISRYTVLTNIKFTQIDLHSLIYLKNSSL